MSGFAYSYAFCSKSLNQIFVDCNRFDKGEINEVFIDWTFKQIFTQIRQSTKQGVIERIFLSKQLP